MSVPVVIAFVIAIVLKRLIPISNTLQLIIQILVYVVIYAIMMWKFGTNQYEKDLFAKPIKKILGK